MWNLDHKEGWDPKNGCFQTVLLEKTLESPLDNKEIQPVNPKGNQSWIFIGRNEVKAEAPILWPPDAKSRLIRKDPDAGKDWRQEEKETTEDEMVGWHHRLNRHEFEQTQEDSKGQGSLVCCSPWGHKELDTTEWLNKNDMEWWKDSSSMKHFPFVLKNFCLWPISTLCFYPSLSPNLSKYCGRVWGLDNSLQKTRSSLREAQLWFLSHR